MKSIIYSSSILYDLLMKVLYRNHYTERYTSISSYIYDGQSILDLCAGPGTLYLDYLYKKQVDYTAVDINTNFFPRLINHGADTLEKNLLIDVDFPVSDIIIMQSSLYHFKSPHVFSVLDSMFKNAAQKVIISEPIQNMSNSSSKSLSIISQILTNPGTGNQNFRYNNESLDKTLSKYSKYLIDSSYICGGREKLFVFNTSDYF
jgi:hypothetical protein